MKSGHREIVQSVYRRDCEEKAIIFLLWGRKGYEGTENSGFSIEKVLKFLRSRKKVRGQK